MHCLLLLIYILFGNSKFTFEPAYLSATSLINIITFFPAVCSLWQRRGWWYQRKYAWDFEHFVGVLAFLPQGLVCGPKEASVLFLVTPWSTEGANRLRSVGRGSHGKLFQPAASWEVSTPEDAGVVC